MLTKILQHLSTETESLLKIKGSLRSVLARPLIRVRKHVQGDQAAWQKPAVDIDMKVAFQYKDLIPKGNFKSMATVGFGQAALSHCRYDVTRVTQPRKKTLADLCRFHPCGYATLGSSMENMRTVEGKHNNKQDSKSPDSTSIFCRSAIKERI